MEKSTVANWLVLLFAIQVAPLFGQSNDESGKAGFTLTLSYHYDHSTFERNVIALDVTLTNTSKETMYESPCAAFGGLYEVVVVHNGVPVDENSEERAHREQMERGEAKGGVCMGSDPGRHAAPGKTLKDILRWGTDKHGTYQFTVQRKAFPRSSSQSVTVRSNTVTVIVPEPEGSEPK